MSTVLFTIAFCLVALFGYGYYQNNQAPVLGVSQGKLKPLSTKPNNVSSQSDSADKKVATLAFKDTQENTMQALKQAVSRYGGGTIKKETEQYLHVVFTTPLMRYRDDVEFWLDINNQEVHFRSASRTGYSDMGLNRQRYNKIAALYQAQ